MSPDRVLLGDLEEDFPRVSGDEPYLTLPARPVNVFSPRERG